MGPVNRPDHVERFPNDVSKLLATDLISVRVSRFKGVPFLYDVRILEHSVNLGAIANHGLVSDWSAIKVLALSRTVQPVQRESHHTWLQPERRLG